MDDDLTTYQNTSKKNYWLMLAVVGILFLLVIICALTYKVISQKEEEGENPILTPTKVVISPTPTQLASPTPESVQSQLELLEGIEKVKNGERTFRGNYASWGGGGTNEMSFRFDSTTKILTATVEKNDWAQGEYPVGASGNDNPPYEGRKYKYEDGKVYRQENGEYEIGDYTYSTGEPDFGFEFLAEDIMQKFGFDLTQLGKVLKMKDETNGELYYFVRTSGVLEEDEELPFSNDIVHSIRLITNVNEQCAQDLMEYKPCENVSDMYFSTRHNWFFNTEGGLIGYSIDSDDAHIVIEYD